MAAPARQWATVMGGPDGKVTAAGPFRSRGRAEGFATRYQVLTDLPAEPVELENPDEVLAQCQPEQPDLPVCYRAALGFMVHGPGCTCPATGRAAVR